tara:strand:+ start:562 stop:1938 length:1377 start_codon:yes stop_codon:yes gene_type:complete
MTPEQVAENRTDLLSFTKTMFKARKGFDLIDNWHQEAICKALERVVIGQCNRLIINIPPRAGKTEIAVINFIAWCMGNWPDSEFIHPSYSSRLATNNTFNVRSVMQHETFTEIFGAPIFRHDSNAKNEFRTEQGGIVYATGADGTITGYGAGKMRDSFGGAIVIDDPHKAGEASSDTRRQNVIDWFSTTIESRKNRPDTPIIIIMQRLHENDLSGFLLGGGNGEKWDHLDIDSEQDGVSFWERQFPWAELKRMEKANPYRYAGQYRQKPAPIGGGIFKDNWWNFYDAIPQLKYRFLVADTAQKVKTQNDYSVMQCWGETEMGQAILLDQVRGKWEAPELLEQARAFWNKHKQSHSSPLRSFDIEDKSSGTGLIQTLKREGVPVIGIQRSIDKISRAMDIAPSIASGNVLLPRNAVYLSDYMLEFSQFPNGTHDDQVDPTMDAIKKILISYQPIIFEAL